MAKDARNVRALTHRPALSYRSPPTRGRSAGDGAQPSQLHVLRLIAEGLNNAAIAERMCLSVKAVENYVGLIFRSLDLDGDCLSRRVAAANLYRERTAL